MVLVLANIAPSFPYPDAVVMQFRTRSAEQ